MEFLDPLVSDDNDPHPSDGIGYIKGVVGDPKTFKTFPALAAADGIACSFSDVKTVYIDHRSNINYASFYGTLTHKKQDIPECNSTDPKKDFFQHSIKVKKGDTLGEADQIHNGKNPPTGLLFTIMDPSAVDFPIPTHNVDPYDINGKRDLYPSPNGNPNGKACGPKTVFDASVCATGPTTGVTEKQSAGQNATIKPNLPPTPEAGWHPWNSTRFGYSIWYPPRWVTERHENWDIFTNGKVVPNTNGRSSAGIRIKSEIPRNNSSVDDLMRERIQDIRRTLGGVKLEPTPFTLDGQSASALSYDIPRGTSPSFFPPVEEVLSFNYLAFNTGSTIGIVDILVKKGGMVWIIQHISADPDLSYGMDFAKAYKLFKFT